MVPVDIPTKMMLNSAGSDMETEQPESETPMGPTALFLYGNLMERTGTWGVSSRNS